MRAQIYSKFGQNGSGFSRLKERHDEEILPSPHISKRKIDTHLREFLLECMEYEARDSQFLE